MKAVNEMSKPEAVLDRTPLYALHLGLRARMVEFAGYEMPLNYPTGILREHLHERAKAGLFDVSHMGQACLIGPNHATTAAALETLVPGNIAGLGLGRMRYTLLLNDEGGIVDDIMVTRSPLPENDGRLFLVVNAARKAIDYAFLQARLPDGVKLQAVTDRALFAVHGPEAAAILARHCPQAESLWFLDATSAEFDGIACSVSRSGYTGDDGFEISVAADKVEGLVRTLLQEPEVLPIGLGARDTLRLEAGLCLYGHDIDETTSPVEADLAWTIPQRRRAEANFPGARRILEELAHGVRRRRVGLKPQGRTIARGGARILDRDGKDIGLVTSGSFGPTVGAPIAMGYIATDFANEGNIVDLVVRGKSIAACVVAMPFVAHRFRRRA
jgi:aminomethyltransferase